jgi:hypothetical protein
MAKTYATPALIAKGDVVEVTKHFVGGPGDPKNPIDGLTMAPGNVGFQL